MKNTTVPAAAKIAKEIKAMELQLAQAMIKEHKEPKTQYVLVEKISKLRTDLTKAHLDCIYNIQKVLSKEQFQTLVTLASNRVKESKEEPKVITISIEEEKGKTLFKEKCIACHTLSRPTDMSKVVAPALNGVMRHLKMTYHEKTKAVTFIKDYVMNPSLDKAICMPNKIKRFGLMPSQKGAVTPKELEVIANWMFENYPQKGFVGMGQGKGMGMMKH
jgi:mono/diheme cytochrome c family protein